MPRLGLGLGIDKQRTITSLPKYLTDAGCTMALNIDRQVKALANPNSPLANPLVDITAKGNNATLTNFAGTANDGYTQQAVKAESGDLVEYSNLVTNGDFSQGTIGWGELTSDLTGTTTVTSNTLSHTCNGAYAFGYSLQSKTIQINKRYYSRVDARVTNSNCNSLQLLIGSGNVVSKNSPVQNTWYSISGILNVISSDNIIYLRHEYTDAVTANGKVAEFQEVIAINLTDNPTVQALEAKLGRQLTVAECDKLFTFVPTTGQVYVKTPFFLKFDGTDSFMMMANTADVDILGLGNFALCKEFVTASTLVNSWLENKGEQSEATTQFGLKVLSTGGLQLFLNGTAINIASGLVINTNYKVVVVRESGVLKCEVNGVETYSASEVTNIATRPNYRLGAISSNVGGTTHTAHFNGFFGAHALYKGTLCTLASVKKSFDKLVSNYI